MGKLEMSKATNSPGLAKNLLIPRFVAHVAGTNDHQGVSDAAQLYLLTQLPCAVV